MEYGVRVLYNLGSICLYIVNMNTPGSMGTQDNLPSSIGIIEKCHLGRSFWVSHTIHTIRSGNSTGKIASDLHGETGYILRGPN